MLRPAQLLQGQLQGLEVVGLHPGLRRAVQRVPPCGGTSREARGRRPEKIPSRREHRPFVPGGDADLCHGVHIDVDKVAGGDGLLGFDVHRHLAQIQLGIEILSCNIQNVTDENGLIKDLGADNTSLILRCSWLWIS